jgi:hypothetical protein
MTKKYLSAAAVFLVALSTSTFSQQWRPVSGSRQANISGMALIGYDQKATSILVVHDNKKKEQLHATIITIVGNDTPLYTPLKWLGDDIPVDLEAVSALPGRSGQFIAFTAAGRAFHIRVDSKSASVDVIRSVDVPMIPKDGDFEAFDVQSVGGNLIAVWAERGSSKKPATIFWGRFDPDNGKISETGWQQYDVPFPTEADVRHVSDIKVDASGGVFVTAASDPGNDGPFASAAYFAGVIRAGEKGKIEFAVSPAKAPLFRFEYHKVEAFEIVPGRGMVFGTDDENLGASILLTY